MAFISDLLFKSKSGGQVCKGQGEVWREMRKPIFVLLTDEFLI